MSLPTGVGYGVGPGSAMQSLVLQVCHAQNAACDILLQIALSALFGAHIKRVLQASASTINVNS